MLPCRQRIGRSRRPPLVSAAGGWAQSRAGSGRKRRMLGAVLAVLSAATFAFNNAAARRGVLTGTAIQGMSITIPVGLLGFVPLALVTGWLAHVPHLAPRSIAWMA